MYVYACVGGLCKMVLMMRSENSGEHWQVRGYNKVINFLFTDTLLHSSVTCTVKLSPLPHTFISSFSFTSTKIPTLYFPPLYFFHQKLPKTVPPLCFLHPKQVIFINSGLNFFYIHLHEITTSISLLLL